MNTKDYNLAKIMEIVLNPESSLNKYFDDDHNLTKMLAENEVIYDNEFETKGVFKSTYKMTLSKFAKTL